MSRLRKATSISRGRSKWVAEYRVDCSISGFTASGVLFNDGEMERQFNSVKIKADNTFLVSVGTSGNKIKFKLEN